MKFRPETYRLRTKRPEVPQRVLELLRVVDLYPEVLFMPPVLLREIRCVLEESRLPTDPYRRVEIEWELPVGPLGFSFDEGVEAGAVGSLGVAVEQEGRVVGVRQTAGVKLLEVGREVVYPLSVEKLVSANSYGRSHFV